MEERVVKEGFHARVYARVKQVPPGHVTTYGDVAAALGSPRVARHVGWALAALMDDETPWHRVVNAKGRISFRGDTGRGGLQRSLLEEEGITFRGEIIDLKAHRWTFSPDDLATS